MINFHKKWIKNSYVKIKNEYQLLDKLDQELGDGDHGTTIFRGLEHAVNSFKTIDQNEPIFSEMINSHHLHSNNKYSVLDRWSYKKIIN